MLSAALASEPSLIDVPIAVLFNKTDLSFALSNEELCDKLDLAGLSKREGPIQSFSISVLRSEGYTEAFQWLAGFF